MMSVHPFPARMASALAFERLKELPANSTVLDPMAGSGTVLRNAVALGHTAIGYDLDPLAVLMSRVSVVPVSEVALQRRLVKLEKTVRLLGSSKPRLPWIDDDAETSKFIAYWFGVRQRDDLRRLAFALVVDAGARSTASLDVLRLAFSRIVVTKDRGASLARDVSHSRPHRVIDVSTFDVPNAYARSVGQLRATLASVEIHGSATVSLGDARSLNAVRSASVDAVVTSPPYLNAIDYLRGHKLSLVWLGHRISELRGVRAHSIGAERAASPLQASMFHDLVQVMVNPTSLSSRHAAMVARYAEDLYRVSSEVCRVLRPGGAATFVVGNSHLRTAFVKNSRGVMTACEMVGLRLTNKAERRIPERHRYLPTPSRSDAPLSRRMKTESVLTFVKE